ncbi:MAG: hypothetical protein IIC60_06345 [Proteobacteria bacterium]|nr:hypothetical protein [Pseudomonadota bacterium]
MSWPYSKTQAPRLGAARWYLGPSSKEAPRSTPNSQSPPVLAEALTGASA